MSNTITKQAALLLPVDTALPDRFMDLTGNGANQRPSDTYWNALIALHKLGLDCSYNIFRNEYLISGHLLTLHEHGELSDLACLALRQLIRVNFNFEPSKQNTQDAVMRYCAMRTFHPIKDYLAPLKWDGIPRVDTFLPGYFRAKDTPFVRAVSRIVLMASVRRILKPGAKFDYITVLESPEGYNKSSALEVLYGADNFTDQSTIGAPAKEVEETLRGKWGAENSEMSGLRKAEWNKLKAMLSRNNDRGRHAYGRNPVNALRTAIQRGSASQCTFARCLPGHGP